MDQYLKLAHVHEIIYSRNYSRLLLANASTGIGLTSVFQDLLDPGGSVFLATKKIDEKFIEAKYADFRTYFEANEPNSTLIGILENSGNSHRAKESAIRRAQQTPNMKQLLDNLQAVKSLRFNKPVFSPEVDYIIRDGSMAIVIEHRQEGGAHV
jgi:voltage-gated potassium channel